MEIESKRKRRRIFATLATFLSLLLVGALASTNIDVKLGFFGIKATENYSITFNYNNGGSSFPSTSSSTVTVNTSAKTNKGNVIDVTYSNVKKSSGNYAVIDNSGYLYNSTRLTGLDDITVTFSGSLSLYTSSSTTFSGTGTAISSGSSITIPANNDYFKLVSNGETTIESIVANYSCSPKQVVYEKVNSTNEVTTGEYLIVYEDGLKAFNGGLSTLDQIQNTINVTISNDQIVSTSAIEAAKFTITSITGGYSIRSSSGYYVGRNTNSNGMNVSEDTEYVNTIDVSSGVATIQGDCTKYLKFNTASDQLRFRFMTNGGDLALYKSSITSGGSGGGSGGSGGEQQTETFTATITKSNCGLPSSTSTQEIYKSYDLTNGTDTYDSTLDVVFSAGSKVSGSNYDTFRLENYSYIAPNNCSLVIQKIVIDYYTAGNANYISVSADETVVQAVASSESGHNVYEYSVDSANWKIYANSSGYGFIYYAKFYYEGTVGPINVTGVTLNKSVLNLLEGGSEQLTATILPSNATDKTLTWASSNESVATVTTDGIVMAQGVGKAVVSATTTDGGFVASCNVNVSAITHVTSVSLNKNELGMHPGETETLVHTVLPDDANNKNVTWSSTNTHVATVAGGTVTAIAAGSTTITVTTEDGSYTAMCNITVTNISVSSVSLNKATTTIQRLSSETLVATVSPANATNQSVTWSSSNTAVATVTNGRVDALAAGTAIITVTTVDQSKSDTCTVTVTPIHVSSVSINEEVNVALNNTFTLSLTVLPDNADDKSVTWSSSNTNVVAVSDGVLTGKALGDATITVTTTDGSKQDTCTVHVIEQASTQDLDPSYLSSSLTCQVNGIDGVKANKSASATITIPKEVGSTTVTMHIAAWNGESHSPSVSYTNCSSSSSLGAIVSDSGVANESPYTLVQAESTFVKTLVLTQTSLSSDMKITITAGNKKRFVLWGVSYTTSGGSVTPSTVDVTGVSVSPTSKTLTVDDKVQLNAVVTPNNATDQTVTWTSNNTSVATVSNSGLVTAKSAGSATITVETNDGGFTATCAITVQSSGGGSSSGSESTFTIAGSDFSGSYSGSDGSHTKTDSSTGESLYFTSKDVCTQSSMIQMKTSGYIYNTGSLTLNTITINNINSGDFTVYAGNSSHPTSTTIVGSNNVYDVSGYEYFTVAGGSALGKCESITITTGIPTPTDPTSISISPSSAEVGIGMTKQLTVGYVPTNANQNKDVTWSSSNTNVATVSSNGLVTVKSTASVGQTATITARLTNLSSISATCTITVKAQSKDDHTVLIYICGADLESKSSLATGDIQEILKVSGQPEDVNIVIETGGANSWASTYGISSSKLERWHVENKSLVKDDSLTYASMGLASTLQSFIEYGLTNYPAERTGLVLWNHGGGMHGVCYDEKKSDDSLQSNEVKSAVSGALSNCGMSGQKLEWIGYDACLMAVQDIAEMNSPYFNYMVASEESEAGEGWDYDNWVDDLYAKKTTPTILKAICDSFISDNGGVNSSGSDQTLSYMDLSYASAYKTAWENMAAQLQNKLTSGNKSTFNTAIINNVKHFADSDYDYFCLFDAKDFINKLASSSAFSSFRIDSSYTTAVLNAHANFVAYSTAQKGAGNANGLCMYWCNSSSYSDMSVYTTSHTNFTTWRSVNSTYGTHK